MLQYAVKLVSQLYHLPFGVAAKKSAKCLLAYLPGLVHRVNVIQTLCSLCAQNTPLKACQCAEKSVTVF